MPADPLKQELPFFAKYIEQYIERFYQETCLKFPTYSDAIAELVRLKMKNVDDSQPQKKPPGRPKNREVFGCTISSTGKRTYKRAKGAPAKTTRAEMIKAIENIARLKDMLEQSGLFKTRRNDKQISRGLVRDASGKKLSIEMIDKQKAAARKLSEQIRYFRDRTGIRQKKKSGKIKK